MENFMPFAKLVAQIEGLVVLGYFIFFTLWVFLDCQICFVSDDDFDVLPLKTVDFFMELLKLKH
jgi:hypothetical protein